VKRNRTSDFIRAFLLALLFHGAAGYCAGSFFRVKVGLVQPVFQTGESSVELTLLPPVVKKVEPELQEPVFQLPVEELPPLKVIKEIVQVEAPPEDEYNADLLEKGVDSEVVSQSSIRPQYPYGSRIRGEEGVVVLTAVLNDSGHALDVLIAASSGHHALDRAAIKAMKKAVFISQSGAPVGGEDVEYTFRFQLKD
jgi:TonB family protein